MVELRIEVKQERMRQKMTYRKRIEPRREIDDHAQGMEELTKKVNWLIDEVYYLRQSMRAYEKRDPQQQPPQQKPYFRGKEPFNGEYRGYPPASGHAPYYRPLSRPPEEGAPRETPYVTPRDPQYYHMKRSFSKDNIPGDSKDGRHHTTSMFKYNNQSPPTLFSNVYPRPSPHHMEKQPHHYEPNVTVETNPNIEAVIQRMLTMYRDINIAEVVTVWYKGMKEIPPVLSWSIELKKKFRSILKDWFCIIHLYRTLCNSDISTFVSRYTNSMGRIMTISEVASLCPNVDEFFELFINRQNSFLYTEFSAHPKAEDGGKIHVLPRKINGRKVSAKDVIELWENGLGDIPPIRLWSKAQKFRQQSKISRWKKIVDIYKHQCGSDMQKFEEIYTDNHGCLLPVAAITSKFETVYGDELNLTSKLMTVSTNGGESDSEDGEKAPSSSSHKRSFEEAELSPDEVSAKRKYEDVQSGSETISGSREDFQAAKLILQRGSSTSPPNLMRVEEFSNKSNSPTSSSNNQYYNKTIESSSYNPLSRQPSMLSDRSFSASSMNGDLTIVERKSVDEEPKPETTNEYNIQRENSYVPSETYMLYQREANNNPPVRVLSPCPNSPGKIIKEECIDQSRSPSDSRSVQTNKSDSTSKEEFSIVFDPQSPPKSTENRYEEGQGEARIIENISVSEALSLWENGSSTMAPIKHWTPIQKARDRMAEKVDDLQFVLSHVFKNDQKAFTMMCTRGDKTPMSVDEVLKNFHASLTERIKRKPLRRGETATSMTFDFSHHKTVSANADVLYLLPRKINGRKVSARDVLQLWYYGLNKIPAVKNWSAQQKSVQQSKISRWKKIVDLFERDFKNDWDVFERTYSNGNGHLLPITAIIAKREEELLRNGSEGSMVVQYKPYPQ